ncbi:MAG: nucleotidyltransferase domain-containing protein, partial [Thermoplasmata archaeon]
MAEFSIEKIKEMLAPLYCEKGLQLVLLFGSIANEKGNRESDIDIGFLFEKPVDILDLTNRVIQLLKTDNVDVVDLCHASPLLRFSTIRKGKLL